MATGKYLAAVIILILAIASISFFLSKTPEAALDCKSGDSICPQGCSYQVDNDCPRTGAVSYGAVHGCLTSSDCVIVQPICGNPDCNILDGVCQVGNFCVTAINKNYASAWNSTNIRCLGVVPKCNAQQKVNMFCSSGECRVQGVI